MIQERNREKGINPAPERLTEEQKLVLAKNVECFAVKHLDQPAGESLAPTSEADLKTVKEAAERKIKGLREDKQSFSTLRRLADRSKNNIPD